MEVWAGNFEVEFAKVQHFVTRNKFTYICFDTEFAGFLRFSPESPYEKVRRNVASRKPIQLGLTLACERKDVDAAMTWQFNFLFDRCKDHYCSDALKVLEEAGINF